MEPMYFSYCSQSITGALLVLCTSTGITFHHAPLLAFFAFLQLGPQ